MAYQGRQPGVGVRNRFIYSATGGQTSFSGADSNGLTLAYADATYVDVFLNGTLLVPVTDYAATTKTSVVLGSGAAASDIVEIVAYDISSMSGAVNKTGGSMTGDLSFGDNDKAIFGAGDDLQIYHNGSNSFLNNTTGDLTLDVSGDVILDANGTDVRLAKGGVQYGMFTTNSTPLGFYIDALVQDGDLFFRGNDGGSVITAITIDMSAGGNVGIGETVPLGKLHIKTADSGATVDAGADELVIEGSGNAGMSILSGASNTGSIYFGDSGTNWDGYIAYSQNSRSMTFGTAAGGGSMTIDSAGRVTMPSQPAFMVNPQSTQENISPNGIRVITWDVERFDQGGNFSSNSFTAPITGKYQLNVELRLDNVDTAATYCHLYLVTSNKTYHNIIQPRFTSDPAYWSLSASVLADMDANDTAYVGLYLANGATQTDVNNDSNFSGYLVA